MSAFRKKHNLILGTKRPAPLPVRLPPQKKHTPRQLPNSFQEAIEEERREHRNSESVVDMEDADMEELAQASDNEYDSNDDFIDNAPIDKRKDYRRMILEPEEISVSSEDSEDEDSSEERVYRPRAAKNNPLPNAFSQRQRNLWNHALKQEPESSDEGSAEEENNAAAASPEPSAADEEAPPPEEIQTRFVGFPCNVVTEHTPGMMTPQGYLESAIFKKGKLNIIRGPLGIGKTTALATFLAENPELLLMVVVPTKNLSRSLANKLKVKLYENEDLDAWKKQKKAQSISICINSMMRLGALLYQYDVIVFDECSGDMNSIISEMFTPPQRLAAMSTISKLVNPRRDDGRNCTIVIMDALLNARELNFLYNFCGIPDEQKDNYDFVKEHVNFVHCVPDTMVRGLPTITFQPSINSFLKQLVIHLLDPTKRTVFTTNMREFSGDLLGLVHILEPNLFQALKLTQPEIDRLKNSPVYWFDKDTDKSKLEMLVRHPEGLADMPKLAYTPVFGSGFSFDVRYDRCFGLFTSAIGDARQLLQQVCRCRDLGDVILCVKPVKSPPKFDCSSMNVARMIEEYNSQSAADKNMLKAALCIQKGGSEAITRYFAQKYEPWLLRFLADSISERLQFMKAPSENIQATMKENHPLWDWRLDTASGTPSRPVDKKLVNELKSFNSDYFYQRDLIKTKVGDLLCMDQHILKKKAKELRVTGQYEIEDLKVSAHVAQKALQDVITRNIDVFRLCFGAFNAIHYMMYLNVCTKSSTLTDEQRTYKMMLDMFEALAWEEHIVTVQAKKRQSFRYIALELEQVDFLQLTTVHIIGRWKPLVDWQTKHQLLLAMKNVHHISLTEEGITEKPSPKAIQVMMKSILGVMNMTGIEYKCVTEKIGKQYPKKNLAPLMNAIKRDSPDLYKDETTPNEFSGGRSATTHTYAVDKEAIWKYIDIALRLDIVAFCETPEPFSKLQAYTMYKNTNTQVSLGDSIVKELLDFIRKKVAPCVKQFMLSPSYWFITDPATYQSQDKLILAFECVKGLFEAFWLHFGMPTPGTGAAAAGNNRIEHQLIRGQRERQRLYKASFQPMASDSDDEATQYVMIEGSRPAGSSNPVDVDNSTSESQ